MNLDSFNHSGVPGTATSGSASGGAQPGVPQNYGNLTPMQLAQQPPPVLPLVPPAAPVIQQPTQLHQPMQQQQTQGSQQQVSPAAPVTQQPTQLHPPMQQQQQTYHHQQQLQYHQQQQAHQYNQMNHYDHAQQHSQGPQQQAQPLVPPVVEPLPVLPVVPFHHQQQHQQQPQQQQQLQYHQQPQYAQPQQVSHEQPAHNIQYQNQQSQSQFEQPPARNNQSSQQNQYEQPAPQQVQYQNQKPSIQTHYERPPSRNQPLPSQQMPYSNQQPSRPSQYEQPPAQQMQPLNQQPPQPSHQQVHYERPPSRNQPALQQPPAQQRQSPNQQSIQNQQPSHQVCYEKPPSRNQPALQQPPAQQRQSPNQQPSQQQVHYDRPPSRNQPPPSQQMPYSNQQPSRPVQYERPSSRNHQQIQHTQDQVQPYQQQNYTQHQHQHPQEACPQHHPQQPSQQTHDAQKGIPALPNTFQGMPAPPVMQGLPAAPSTTSTFNIPTKPKPNPTLANKQLPNKAIKTLSATQNQPVRLTQVQQFIVAMKQFKIFLIQISKHVDSQWPLLERQVQNVQINASKHTSQQQCYNTLMVYHQFATNLINTRKVKIVEKKEKIELIKTTEEMHKIYKIVFAEIYLLKQACERGVKTYDDVLHTISGEETLQHELKQMQQLYRNSSGFEKKMHETRNLLQTLMKNHKAVSQLNAEIKKDVKPSAHHARVTTGKHGVGKVNISKRRTSGSTSKKKNGLNSKPNGGKTDNKGHTLVAQGDRREANKQSGGSGINDGDGQEAKKHAGGSGPKAVILDDFPDRLVNPLLELPQPSLVGERILPVSEYLKLMEIYFPEPDSFPLSYYSKLLGIDIPDSKTLKDGANCDEWMQIPPLGKYASVPTRLCNDTLASIDLNGSRSDRDFDHVDPTWTSILNEYRGYKDEYLKQATEMNKPCHLSEECITFATDAGILGKGTTFKVVTTEDVPKLCVLAKINNVCAEPSWFEQIIKSGNHFIIAAIASENDLIGYVHYQFCWFRPRSKNPLSVEEVALERVVHIESIRLSDERTFEGNVLLVLIALVLEHSRRHVLYGMMELPPALVPFLTRYFRMSVIAPSFMTNALLVCDVEKCSFRYAFHTLMEDKLATVEKRQLASYRLLVQLPTSRRVAKVQDLPSNALVLNSTAPDPDAVNTRAPPTGHSFSAGDQKDKNKSITVSILDDCVTVKKVPNRSPQKISHPKNFKNVLNQENWNALAIFETSSKPEACSPDFVENNTVVSSLKKLQGQLATLENKNRPILEKLLVDVRDERLAFEVGNERKRRRTETEVVTNYEAEILRRIEAQMAIEAKLEEDDNAVCDICGDGESSGENRIIFCDSCDVSVHQHCYGVDIVPRGDYFCRACIYHKKQQQTTSEPESALEKAMSKAAPIKCEICPKKNGAFVQTQTFSKDKNSNAKWVHFLCAKWQGLGIVEGTYVNGELVFMVEDIQPIKDYFRLNEIRCYLCKGMRGAYNQCRHEGCERYMHVTCARSSGLCEVIHGDDHIGSVDSPNIWTLCCPEHSTFSDDYTPPSNKVSLEALIALAKTFPIEAKPVLPPEPTKPFSKMSGKERRLKLKDPEYEEEFLDRLMRSTFGMWCEVCDLTDSAGVLMKCETCSSIAHTACCTHNPWKEVQAKDSSKFYCASCVHKENNGTEESFESPECHMCFAKHGTLVPCSATPMTMKRWKNNTKQFERSLFGRDIWCHPVCGMWHPKTVFDEDGAINCTNIIMANGLNHVEGSHFCGLCGQKDRLKVQCKLPNKKKPCQDRFHSTCARQAGLEVSSNNAEIEMPLMCFYHSRCDFAFRAMLEDMIEFEKLRAGNDLSRSGGTMKLECAANIFNAGVRVLRCLGWAWQWSQWWVNNGDNWEPLLEEGQDEANMTKEQLKIVESTPTSRREDARKCRLAAFSAALRNRDYDKNTDDDRQPLHNALRAVFSTPSLVGPLSKAEINFFVDWLGRVYRSKSSLLGLGDAKIPVNEIFERNSPVYFKDQTPKFELGARSLPGNHVKNNFIFEVGIQEVDDYFEIESSIPLITINRGDQQELSTSISSFKSKSKKRKSVSSSSSVSSKPASVPSKKLKSGQAPKTIKTSSTPVIAPVSEKSRAGRKKSKRNEDGTFGATPIAATVPAKTKSGWPKGKPRKEHNVPTVAEDDGIFETKPIEATVPAKKKIGWPKGKPRKENNVPTVAEDDGIFGTKPIAAKVPAKKKTKSKAKPGWPKGKPRKVNDIPTVTEDLSENTIRSRSGRNRGSSVDDSDHSTPSATASAESGYRSKPGGKRGRPSLEDRIIENSIRAIDAESFSKSEDRRRRPNLDSSPKRGRPSLDDPIPKKSRQVEEPISKKSSPGKAIPKKSLLEEPISKKPLLEEPIPKKPLLEEPISKKKRGPGRPKKNSDP